MKKILSLLVIISVLNVANAQDKQIISLGASPHLLLNGAYDYDDTPVLHISFRWLTSFESGNEIGTKASFANLQPYQYFDYGFLYNRNIKIFKNEKFETLAGADMGLIVRTYPGYDTQKVYFDYGINAQIRFWISDKFGVYITGDIGPRNDLDYYGDHQAIHYNTEVGAQFSF